MRTRSHSPCAAKVVAYLNIFGAVSSYTQGDNSVVVATDSSVSLFHSTIPPVFKVDLLNFRQYSEEHY